MLLKKELAQIPIQNYPSFSLKAKKAKYVASVQVLNLKRSGKVLDIDVFSRGDKTLQLRFFSDGNSFLTCQEWPAGDWLKRMPSSLLEVPCAHGWDIDATESDIKCAHEILKNRQKSWYYVTGIKSEMDCFARGLSEEKQEKAMDRKYSKMNSHFEMFPEYPADLAEYCETNVFGYTYIFLSKIQKNTRKAVCGHCGHEFSVSKELKPGQNGTCPECTMTAKYRAMWTNGPREEKRKICIAYKVEGQLLIRWTNIVRTFDEMKYKYSFYDYFRNLYLHTSKGPTIYAYDYKSMISWGERWYRQKNGTSHHGKSFVYTNNLKEVFGESYYNVNLETGLKNAGKLSFAILLSNLKNIPAAEYLFKMGMSALAAGITSEYDLGNGPGFSGVLGISKQYLPLYRKYNVSPLEHEIIKASKTWVSESNFERLRLMDPGYFDFKDIAEMLKTMSFERFTNYFLKQKAILGKKPLTCCLTLYKDYLSMSESLKVDMSRKSIRFPRNIQEAHDLILPRFNQVKCKKEDESFKRAVEKLYSGMKTFAKGDYCIVFPALRSDLITEGQSLNHCVGADRYYKNHIAGTNMIFFVRRAEEPEKPYFTMEIDMKNLRILQLYGFGDCAAPPEVRKFTNEFLRKLKPIREEERSLAV